MKTIIAGGRDYQFGLYDVARLNHLLRVIPITEVVSGGARGTDREGELWADLNKLPIKRFPANWTKYGHAAGPIRNREMAKYADALVAFPGDRGTADMVAQAKKAGLLIHDLRGVMND
jgi:hypothetical protein